MKNMRHLAMAVFSILALLCAPLVVNPAWALTVGPSADQNPNYVWDSNPNLLNGATAGCTPSGSLVSCTATSVTVKNDLTQGLHTVAPGNPSMTATGITPGGGADPTAFKTSGTNEHGLGFLTDPNPGENEIFDSRWIQANVSQLLADHFVNGELRVQSVQTPESFSVFGSNTAGVPGTLLLSGELPAVSDKWIDLPGWGTFNFYGVFVDNGTLFVGGPNVLFDSIGAQLPEPGTLLLLGSGLAAIALRRRRKV